MQQNQKRYFQQSFKQGVVMLRVISTVLMFASGVVLSHCEPIIPSISAVILAICGTTVASYNFFKS